MTSHILHVTFEEQEGAMLRLMGLLHRRGFEVSAIDMPKTEGTLKSATITVEPKGPGFRVDILKKQIERLIEVREVRIVQPQRKRNILNFFKSQAEEQAQAQI